jgi:lysophospholipase L1-like esterase
VYELLYPEQEDSPEYDRSSFVPDVVVVALGTNDFSPGDSERPPLDVEPYVEAYIEFVERLRGYYPDAHIFCLSSPMLGDGWPDSNYKSSSNLIETIHAVEDHFADEGDDLVHAFEVSKLSGLGCGTHPNVAQHETLGEELAAEIAGIVGWE